MTKFQLKVNDSGTIGTMVVDDILQVTAEFFDRVDGNKAFGDTGTRLTYHNRYHVTLVNLKTGERCSYFFHDNHINTMEKDIHPEDLGESILACIKMDWYYTRDNYPTFEEFAHEFGYDMNDVRAKRQYDKSIRLGDNLQRVVPEDLLDKLPD